VALTNNTLKKTKLRQRQSLV